MLCGEPTAKGVPCKNDHDTCRWHGAPAEPKDKHPNHPHPNPVQRAEDIDFVWRKTRGGWSGQRIADELGISTTTVSKLLKEGRLLHAPPGLEEERVIALMRNQHLYELCMEEIETGGPDSATLAKLLTVADSLEKSRRRLLGLDAPKKVDLTTHEMDSADVELNEIINSEKARRADREAKIRGDGLMDT